jgi:hypothetical protein
MQINKLALEILNMYLYLINRCIATIIFSTLSRFVQKVGHLGELRVLTLRNLNRTDFQVYYGCEFSGGEFSQKPGK